MDPIRIRSDPTRIMEHGLVLLESGLALLKSSLILQESGQILVIGPESSKICLGDLYLSLIHLIMGVELIEEMLYDIHCI